MLASGPAILKLMFIFSLGFTSLVRVVTLKKDCQLLCSTLEKVFRKGPVSRLTWPAGQLVWPLLTKVRLIVASCPAFITKLVVYGSTVALKSAARAVGINNCPTKSLASALKRQLLRSWAEKITTKTDKAILKIRLRKWSCFLAAVLLRCINW